MWEIEKLKQILQFVYVFIYLCHIYITVIGIFCEITHELHVEHFLQNRMVYINIATSK